MPMLIVINAMRRGLTHIVHCFLGLLGVLKSGDCRHSLGSHLVPLPLLKWPELSKLFLISLFLPLGPVFGQINVSNASLDQTLALAEEAYEQQRLPEAYELFLETAKTGSVTAMLMVARMCEQGIGTSEDMQKARDWYKIAAAQNSREAQYRLGVIYDRESIIGVDFAQAKSWYENAAQLGHALSQTRLAEMYEHGEGASKDPLRAKAWYERAAKQGAAVAQYRLGWMYDHGEGTERDPVVAKRWYTEAANQGHAEAQFQLGNYYAVGELEPRNVALAIEWYRHAAAQGHAQAQTDLASLLLKEQGDEVEALSWYILAAQQEHPTAEFNLGVFYSKGLADLPASPSEARHWWERSRGHGYVLPDEVSAWLDD